MKKKNRILKILCIVLVCVLVVTGTVFGVYVHDYYHMDNTAKKALKSTDTVTVKEESDRTVFTPEKYDTGLVFYPGGKVEYQAYAPLMQEYAEHGILCVLVKMPFNLAVFNADKAEDVIDDDLKVKNWYIGGHSLGGSMAAYCAYQNADDFKGIVFLGSYSTKDLKNTKLKAVSLYGSEDRILNRESYQNYHDNLPKDTIEEVLIGGNHSQFGSYGLQEGDGHPSISASRQREETVDYTIQMMQE